MLLCRFIISLSLWSIKRCCSFSSAGVASLSAASWSRFHLIWASLLIWSRSSFYFCFISSFSVSSITGGGSTDFTLCLYYAACFVDPSGFCNSLVLLLLLFCEVWMISLLAVVVLSFTTLVVGSCSFMVMVGTFGTNLEALLSGMALALSKGFS